MIHLSFKKIIFLALLLGAFLIGWFWSSPFQKDYRNNLNNKNNIKILVSIKPIYSLVCGLTKNIPGVSTALLLPSPHSPHNFQLKPSDITKIVQANLIIWVGPELENFLINPLSNLKSKTQIFNLMHHAPLRLLNTRQNAQWEPHQHGDETENNEHNHDNHHSHTHDTIDAHIWLNTNNVKQFILSLCKQLQILDPIHKSMYLKNANRLISKLDKLNTELKDELQPIQKKPFLVFHDAYQYFEDEFGLNAKGSISINPQVPLSAQRLHTIEKMIKTDNIHCVFSEPEFNQGLVKKLLENTSVKNLELDPLGARIKTHPRHEEDIYFNLMRNIGQTFKRCLTE